MCLYIFVHFKLVNERRNILITQAGQKIYVSSFHISLKLTLNTKKNIYSLILILHSPGILMYIDMQIPH